MMLLAAGCSKEKSLEEEDDTNYFIKFNLGTEVKEYRDVVLAIRSTANGMNGVSVQGQATLTDNNDAVLITITELDPIVAKTYTENATSDSPVLAYRDASGNEFSTLFATVPTGVSVTIENINEASVRGTFSGTLYDLQGNPLEISNASFYAKFQ